MKNFITGDNHGEHSIHKLSHSNWKIGKELNKEDFVITAGDWGFIFNPEYTETDNYWLNWLQIKPWTTLVVDGNHENFNRINQLPTMQWNGGEVGVIAPNIYHLKRGQVFTLNNKKVFVMGGARSEDKAYRTEHISWWKEEEPSYGEMQKGLCALEEVNWNVDYVVSHTAPYSIIEQYQQELRVNYSYHYNLIDYFDEILKKLQFKRWYFGHFHVDKKLNDRFYCLYHNVKNMEEI